jgi:DNA-binding response OmpR family regulator
VSGSDVFALGGGARPDLARFREAGELTLDSANRDARADACWLLLSEPEFELIWRLAEHVGERVGLPQLAEEIGAEKTAIADLAAQVRSRLEPFALADILGGDPDAGYVLDIGNLTGADDERTHSSD